MDKTLAKQQNFTLKSSFIKKMTMFFHFLFPSRRLKVLL